MPGAGLSAGPLGAAAGGGSGATGLSVVTSYHHPATHPAQLMSRAIKNKQQIRRC